MSESYARYDYAWKTQGWTVQNPSFVGNLDTYVAPGLPDVPMVRVWGSFLEFETGRPLEGVIRIRTSVPLVHTPSGSQVMPSPQRIRFTKGYFSLYLPATDSVSLAPEFLYEATLTVAGRRQEFKFLLPEIEDEVNILSKVPDPTGSLDFYDDQPDDVTELGAVPDRLVVNVVTGADFVTTVQNQVAWPDNTTVTLILGNGMDWEAVLSGTDATFTVDKAVVDTVPDGTSARLVVSIDGDEQPWAVGTVVRHG